METTQINYENEQNNLIIQPNEKPKNIFVWILLSLQHVFAMFGATVLVPFIIGLDPSIAILSSGIGTLVYIACTKGKVPIYLGSSFAFITATSIAFKAGGHGAVAAALIGVGLVYIVISIILRFTGMNWINRVIPPIVIGPMIMVIGLSLASGAVGNAGLAEGEFNITYAAIACFTLLITALTSIIGKGFFKIIPILVGILSGYVFSLILGVVDTSIFSNMTLFSIPNIQIPGITYSFDFTYVAMFLPIALVTIAEHIGEHSITSNICKKDFLKDPGLKNTLLGDGLASIIAGLIGGPANTTYGENNGVIAMTKVASVYVIGLAAIFAIVLAFINPVSLFIKSIPSPVMGGISIMLFGIIASNGVKIMIENRIDFTQSRNLVIAATMLVLGIGGATFAFSETFSLAGMSAAAVVGIILNLVLPKDKNYEDSIVEKEL
ncbi:NCS2 family nucleobase:cation symporter [Erysipelotrichaceae bacterium OttesenSCG-928-M19]|nr:NCS2 family nucleobase:cation symporter [Erysipelotrichaceae bacterium OttesenSCG-928-M19]